MANEIIKGVIEKKYQKEITTVKGKATRTAYKIDGKTYSTLDKKLGGFNEGDTVELAYVVSGDFNNIIDGEKSDGATEEDLSGPNTPLDKPIAGQPSQAYWESKDRRIVRQNALTQANEFLKLVKDKFPEKVSDDMLTYLFEVAKKCEEFVYRKEDD